MTPEDAEAEAKRLDIAPLIMQPDPAQFDPMNEVAWTLPMVAAWRAFRDVDAVRVGRPLIARSSGMAATLLHCDRAVPWAGLGQGTISDVAKYGHRL